MRHYHSLVFCKLSTCEKERWKVIIWIDNKYVTKFVTADNFEVLGELLSEIRISNEKGKRMVNILMNLYLHAILCLKLKECLIEFKLLMFIMPGL
jgi:hypothetical protein